jgi:hypothetical protein
MWEFRSLSGRQRRDFIKRQFPLGAGLLELVSEVDPIFETTIEHF